jgi:hypothetical protein
MKAKSIKGKSNDEIAIALKESMTDGFTPTIAIVFMSVKQDREAISKLLDEKSISIFGATSCGEFIDGEIEEESTVIMLLDLNPEYFKIAFEETGDSTTREAGRKIGALGKATFTKPAFIVASGGVSADGEMVVRGIEDGAGEGITIFGGCAGDDLNMTASYAFTNQKATDNGVVAIIINEEKVKIKGVATSGWKPVGTSRTVTKSEGNIVYTIDDEPALDIVMKYLGLTPSDFNKVNDTIINFGVYFPLQVQRENAPPVMRTAMLANVDERSLICAGSVSQGSKIKFSLPPDFDIVDQVVSDCNQLKKEHIPDADAMVFFSCKARHLTLGPVIGEEIEAVKNVWNKPMAGYFCYGEMGKTIDGKHEFHNSTCCLVLLKEESNN